ncbi:Inner membrane protein YgaP [Erythrobacter sp. THAF29]|nr:rhodanese family protein [Erythrobacter sp. THAF29]QFT76142.1 Inner membrane protein YgaP [Erythrobacter sp. THAF29]
MAIRTISPAEAASLVKSGARLIDIRAPDEFRRAKANEAENRPLDSLFEVEGTDPVVFMCKSGMRTGANSARLQTCCAGDAYIVDGGLDAWRSSGLPVEEDASQPIEIMRQVQIAAGILILVGVVLGTLTSPLWYGLSGFVGAGLLFAGVTGWCGMANLLSLMPWNRRASA